MYMPPLSTWLAAGRRRAQQLRQELHALSLALRHPDTPWLAQALIALAVAYALSPIDLIPDVIPLLGLLDDLLLLPALIALALRLIPPELLAHCRAQAAAQPLNGRPRWWMTALILLLWGLALGGASWWLWQLRQGA